MSHKYEIHHRRWYDTPRSFTLFAKCNTLGEARRHRIVSGDLVVHATTHKIVQDPEWLWGWEKADPDCYVQKAIKSGL